MKRLGVFFSRRWILATVLVLAGAALCARLGIWQLDRLDQRRAFNSRVSTQQAQPVLVLDAAVLRSGDLEGELNGMEYRAVRVTGVYDFEQQVVLRNQVHGNFSGLHLLTPLRITDSDRTVLVDRGWIPAEDALPENWGKYDEPGEVTVMGLIRAGQSKPDFGRIADAIPVQGERLESWNLVNLSAIALQLPYPLLGMYVQQSPDPAWTDLPYRSAPDLELTEGPHMGYAIQWFTFAVLLLGGYPVFVNREESRALPSKNS